MSKSQETFSKKEKEKKRLKKRQDKAQKKEERKANSLKGKSLEDMMAYVDENGNITTTMPDPKKKKVFIADDIRISVTRQVADPADSLRTGKIAHFNHDKGYGFIKDAVSQESIFVHINSIDGVVKENDHVVFETEKGPKGISAIRVKKVSETAPIPAPQPTDEPAA
ncbi:MAG: cold-shock protein [Bacteroidota bacterium]|jgi:cold shock CspA family protein